MNKLNSKHALVTGSEFGIAGLAIPVSGGKTW